MASQVSVQVDQERCISAGRCLSDVPEAFAFNDDELAQVLPGAGQVELRRLEEVARNCPGQAITISVTGG
jgi:ferredoxin